MRIYIGGKIYDSRFTPILIELDPEEQMGMGLPVDRILATPVYMTEKDKMDLAVKDISRLGYLEMFMDTDERKKR
jgi:hypothetical protein